MVGSAIKGPSPRFTAGRTNPLTGIVQMVTGYQKKRRSMKEFYRKTLSKGLNPRDYNDGGQTRKTIKNFDCKSGSSREELTIYEDPE